MNPRARKIINRWCSIDISSRRKSVRFGVQIAAFGLLGVAFALVVIPMPELPNTRLAAVGTIGLLGVAAQFAVCVHLYKADNVPLYVRDAFDLVVATSAVVFIYALVLAINT